MIARAALSGLFLTVATLTGNAILQDWGANLAPLGESTVRGTATASTMPGDSLDIRIMIENATPGDAHPWHLHSGSCPRSGAVLGGEASYAAIDVGDDRAGSAQARVAVTLTEGGAYSVNVHRSANDHTAIACGDLQPVSGGGNVP